MSEINNTLRKFAEDRSLFTKRRYIFRNVWGIDPSTGRSYSDTSIGEKKRLDPLHNGISLDIVGERTGGVSNQVRFSENSLFKLIGLHVPNSVADKVEKDISFHPLKTEEYEKIQAMSERHAKARYEMAVFIDQQVKLFTYVNTSQFKEIEKRSVQFLRLGKKQQVENHWALDKSQRVFFQVYNGLISSKRPYDMKLFRTTALPSDFKERSNISHFDPQSNPDFNAAQTVYGKTRQKQGAKFAIYPCTNDPKSGQWTLLTKREIESEITVRHLATDVNETFKVLSVQKLFDAKKVKWCIDLSDFRAMHSGKGKKKSEETLIPFYEIDYNENENTFSIRTVINEDVKLEMYLGRLRTRFNLSSKERFQFSQSATIPAFDYNNFLKHVNEKIHSEMDSFRSKPSLFDLCNTSHMRLDDDIRQTDLPGNSEKMTYKLYDVPLFHRVPQDYRQHRCLVAHNPKTKEIVVQYLPIIHDFYEITEKILTSISNEKDRKLTDATEWFTNLSSMVNSFININSKNIFPTCKRNIIGTSVSSSRDKVDADMLRHQLSDPDCPLIKHSVVFDSERLSKVSSNPEITYKKFVECQIQVNLEKLGFHLYGDVDVLYDLERMFHEMVFAIDQVYVKGHHSSAEDKNGDFKPQTEFIRENHVRNSSSTRTTVKSTKRMRGFYRGELLRSKQSVNNWFGKNYDEHVYHVVDVLDVSETRKKVRHPTFVKELLEARSQAKIAFDEWIKRTDEVNGNGGMFSNFEENQWLRYQLVYQPVTRKSLHVYNVLPHVPKLQARSLLYNYGFPRLKKEPARDLAFGIRPKRETPLEIERAHFSYILSCQLMFQVDQPNYISFGMYEYGKAEDDKEGKKGVTFNRFPTEQQKQDDSSFLAFPYSGLEKDVLELFTYVVEPSNDMKEIMNLDSNNSHNSMVYSRLESNKNWLENDNPNFASHPLFSKWTGRYLADEKKGSIWSIPNVRSENCNSLTPFDITRTRIKNPSIQTVKEDDDARENFGSKRPFFSPSDLVQYVSSKWSVGGEITNSSIRVELPDFLQDTYNYAEKNFQEYGHYTNQSSSHKLNDRKHAQRSVHVDMNEDLPVPIKRRKVSNIGIHFFNTDGSRPRQKAPATLLGEKSLQIQDNETQFTPVRNVEICIYEPKLSNELFDKTKEVNFFASEIQLQAKQNQNINVNTLKVMNNIFNYFNPLRRLSITYGKIDNEIIEGKVREKLDTEGSFYNKVRITWFNVRNANEALTREIKRLKRKKSLSVTANQIIETVLDSSVGGGVSPYEFRIEIEHVTIPLNVVNLGDDQTVYIISDFTMNPDEITSIDGISNRKIVARLELDKISNVEEKINNGFTETFSFKRNSTDHALLVSYPFTLVNLNDVVQYSFTLTNSSFEQLKFKQNKKQNNESYKPTSLEIMVKMYTKFNLQNYT